MFKINFRIVNDIDKLKIMQYNFFDSDYEHIEGFFEVCIGIHREGCYYHENPLQVGETGGELLDYWFGKLLDVSNNLSITSYIAFKELETTNRWLEFSLKGDNVAINVAIDEKEKNKKLFINDVFDGFQYIDPSDFLVDIRDFKYEIESSARKFLSELEEINPDLLKTKMAVELSKKLTF